MKKVLGILIAFLILLSLSGAVGAVVEHDHNHDGHPDNGRGDPHTVPPTGDPHFEGEPA